MAERPKPPRWPSSPLGSDDGLRGDFSVFTEPVHRSDIAASEKKSVAESHDVHPSGVIGTLLKKHFSWENLVVLLVGDGVGLSLCIAAGDAALRKDWNPMFAGFGIGLPLMAIATSFPFWKNHVAKLLRDSVVHIATGGFAIILLAAVVYVLGPYLLPQPKGPSAAEIAATVIRNMQGSGALLKGQIDVSSVPEPNYVKNITLSWDFQNPLTISANMAVTGDRLRVFVQDFPFDPISLGVSFTGLSPILLDEFGSLVEGQTFVSQIITLSTPPGPDEKFVFGHAPGTRAIENPSTHLLRIFFLLGSSPQQQNYKLELIMNNNHNNRLTVLKPETLDEVAKWLHQ
jgi:hypothetical protein